MKQIGRVGLDRVSPPATLTTIRNEESPRFVGAGFLRNLRLTGGGAHFLDLRSVLDGPRGGVAGLERSVTHVSGCSVRYQMWKSGVRTFSPKLAVRAGEDARGENHLA